MEQEYLEKGRISVVFFSRILLCKVENVLLVILLSFIFAFLLVKKIVKHKLHSFKEK